MSVLLAVQETATTGILEVVADVVAAVLLLAGSVLALTAGLGALRFPDLLARMHAVAKPQVLGLVLMLLGLALRLRVGAVVWMLLLVALFQMLTSPVAAHMVSRAGYRTGKVRSDLLVVDELTRDLDVARQEVREDQRVADEHRDREERAGGPAAVAAPGVEGEPVAPEGGERGRHPGSTDTGPAEPLA